MSSIAQCNNGSFLIDQDALARNFMRNDSRSRGGNDLWSVHGDNDAFFIA
jgi:hypothetical protein